VALQEIFRTVDYRPKQKQDKDKAHCCHGAWLRRDHVQR
jgi:hypothetical protein